MDEISTILRAIDDGDPDAANRLMPAVYNDLRRLAQARLASERAGDSLQATALVHEVYLRLISQNESSANEMRWAGRAHFFAAAATAMRRILIDRARARATTKRGGARVRVELGDADGLLAASPESLLNIHEALNQLAQEDPQKAQLVELRFFAGLSIKDAAGVLNMSPSQVDRHWAYARARLFDILADEHPESAQT
ncbi:MAG: ECF-type sigma factor [Phycisphaerae bacterium]